MRAIRSEPCGVLDTPLAEDRAAPGAFAPRLQLGFRGFAAGFQLGLDRFLTRCSTLFDGVTRINELEGFLSCVSDMRPDYLILADVDTPSALLSRIQKAAKTAHLGVLVVGDTAARIPTQSNELVVDTVAPDASRDDIALLLRALMRRARPQAMVGQISWGDLVLDEACLTLAIRGASVTLNMEVFSVLGLMMDDPGRDWDRATLHRYVFGAGSSNDIRAIDTRMSRARRHVLAALGIDPIRTVRGVGYALVAEP